MNYFLYKKLVKQNSAFENNMIVKWTTQLNCIVPMTLCSASLVRVLIVFVTIINPDMRGS